MKKGNILRGISAAVLSALLLTGCVDAMPDLTAEQSELIAEYAAGLILKYSPKYEYKIARSEQVLAAREMMREETETETAPAEESQTETQTEQDSPKDTAATGGASPETETQEPQPTEVILTSDADLASMLGIEGVVIRYQSFEICSSYPQNNAGFSVSGAQGKKLLVVHFDIEGLPDKDVDCSLFEYSISAGMNINGTGSVAALSTLLPNDLSSFSDVIPAGETVDAVLLAEINDMAEQEIQSMTMRILSKGKNCTVQLK